MSNYDKDPSIIKTNTNKYFPKPFKNQKNAKYMITDVGEYSIAKPDKADYISRIISKYKMR